MTILVIYKTSNFKKRPDPGGPGPRKSRPLTMCFYEPICVRPDWPSNGKCLWSVGARWEWPAHLTLTLSSCHERRCTESFNRDVLETLIVLIWKVCEVVEAVFRETQNVNANHAGCPKVFDCQCICDVFVCANYLFIVAKFWATELQFTFYPSSIQRETALLYFQIFFY